MDNTGLKIGRIPTDKLVVMVDVSRREYNKQLSSLRNLQQSGSSELEDLEKIVKLWKNRYNVSFTELTRRVSDQFNSMDSELSSED